MKLAYFHSNTIRSSWSLWASARALRRLGHDVIDVAVPTDWNGCVCAGEPENAPTLETLRECTTLVLGPEFIDGWLAVYYGRIAWDRLPKIGFAAESTQRRDLLLDWGARIHYTQWFWPDPSDVKTFGGRLHEPHVDINVFRPARGHKRIDVGFAGVLYAKRKAFLSDVRTPINLQQAFAYTAFGEAHEEWTACYVRSLQATKISVDLPSNNPMQTSRPFEVMAAGSCLVTWAALPPDFVEGLDYRRYHTAKELDDVLADLLGAGTWKALGVNGCRRVRAHDSYAVWARMLALT
jgi:hypothetical protein